MQKRARNLADDELLIEVMADRGRNLLGETVEQFDNLKLKIKKFSSMLMFGLGRANQFGWLRTVLLMTF